ncbi:hypothetical protein QYF61_006992 [Mycteria americana]|uniref:Uncharacterized protein n=1 Tax=Mycteria americana TaxID=33587 RepID=A0AAN7RK28_MYCAM|nr:hypothetical protein QYF61_006992 [Mycteria americana]
MPTGFNSSHHNSLGLAIPPGRSKFSVLLRLQRHHKEHIFYISYHHLGLGIVLLVSVHPSPFRDDDLQCYALSLPRSGWVKAGLGCPDPPERDVMRGFTVGGTTAYRIATTTSRDGEEMEGGFRGDPQHSPEDLHIGQHNVNKASKIKKNAKHKQPNFPEGICHGFGDSGGDGAQVKNREVEEEEVHGGVEAVVAGHGGDDEAVAQEGSQVDAQEEPEVQELQLPRVCKCQEEELGGGAAVGHLFTLSKGPGQGGKGSDK